MKTVAETVSAKMCAGCSACVGICPKGAISLVPDEWGYYRRAVDETLCVDCGLCSRVCPALQLPNTGNSLKPDCYEFIASDDDVLRRSSSGGIFTTLAVQILEKGGAVVGAAWRDDFTVEHIIVESKEDLWKLQKSKYLQSYMGSSLRQVKAALESGRLVMFTGTPCQVAGLRTFLGKDYENLLAVDILCGNAPSAMFFKKYIAEEFGDSLKSYEFRHKSEKKRWDCIYVQITLTDGRTFTRSGPKDDDYQRVYHNHVMCAPHCEQCKYQAFPRMGDLSIGDFWWIRKHDPELDTFKGVSLVLCNSKKGKMFFDEIPGQAWRVKKQVPLEWMGGNGHSLKGGKNWCSPQRDTFYDAIVKMSFKQAVVYALGPREKVKTKKMPFIVRIKRGIRCYQENGLRYTLNRVFEHLTGKV